jgi:hypothetical protein
VEQQEGNRTAYTGFVEVVDNNPDSLWPKKSYQIVTMVLDQDGTCFHFGTAETSQEFIPNDEAPSVNLSEKTREYLNLATMQAHFPDPAPASKRELQSILYKRFFEADPEDGSAVTKLGKYSITMAYDNQKITLIIPQGVANLTGS